MENLSPHKFIHQVVLNGDKTHDNISTDEIDNIEHDQTAWQHIDGSQPESQAWLMNEAQLDVGVANALCADETRPRSFKSKNGILVVLRGVNMNPGHDPEDMVAIRVWLEKNRIISVRHRPVMSLQDIIEDLENGDGPRTSGEFLTELVDKLANRIGEFVNGIDEELAETEDNLEQIKPADLRETLGSLRRQIAVVRRYLAPQRDVLDRLKHIDQQRLRDESDRVTRYLEDLDLARERAVVLQEAFLAQIAQQQNARMYVISILSAIFLPLGFLTGLLGINIGGIPGAANPNAFWVFVVVLVVIVGFQFWVFRKLKWF
jgi:zinc transporter